jgi:Protein of unknown function (DUF3987)
MGGLSSGEGLIYAVRDEVRGERKGEEVVLDPGEPDKRLLAVEGELAGLLKVMAREGNTLSSTIRQAWDGDRLRTMTKNNPTRSTGAHVSIIGHVTKAELLRHLGDTEAANGFANRFLWLMVRRSKVLPFGGDVPREALKELSRRLDAAVRFGRKPRPVRWGESAREPWTEVYGPLSEGERRHRRCAWLRSTPSWMSRKPSSTSTFPRLSQCGAMRRIPPGTSSATPRETEWPTASWRL